MTRHSSFENRRRCRQLVVYHIIHGVRPVHKRSEHIRSDGYLSHLVVLTVGELSLDCTRDDKLAAHHVHVCSVQANKRFSDVLNSIFVAAVNHYARVIVVLNDVGNRFQQRVQFLVELPQILNLGAREEGFLINALFLFVLVAVVLLKDVSARAVRGKSRAQVNLPAEVCNHAFIKAVVHKLNIASEIVGISRAVEIPHNRAVLTDTASGGVKLEIVRFRSLRAVREHALNQIRNRGFVILGFRGERCVYQQPVALPRNIFPVILVFRNTRGKLLVDDNQTPLKILACLAFEKVISEQGFAGDEVKTCALRVEIQESICRSRNHFEIRANACEQVSVPAVKLALAGYNQNIRSFLFSKHVIYTKRGLRVFLRAEFPAVKRETEPSEFFCRGKICRRQVQSAKRQPFKVAQYNAPP